MSRIEPKSGSVGDSQSPSSVTRTFSSDLNNAFSIDKDLDGKQALSSQSQELEAIEAKLRETEERFKEKQSSPEAKRKIHAGPERQSVSTGEISQSHSTSVTPMTSSKENPSGSPASQAPSASTMSYWRPSMPGTFAETPGEGRQNSYMGERPDTS